MFCHSQVHAALGPLSVAVRRPSLAALAALPALMKRKVPNKDRNGEDLGNDESNDELNQELNREGFDVHSPGEVVAVESGKSRVAMRVNARVDTLRLALLLDDADEPDFDEVSHSIGADFGKARVNLGCVAEARVSNLVANVSLYPSTLAAKFTLGALTVCDPRLPATHPYRWAVSGGGSNVGGDSRTLPDSSGILLEACRSSRWRTRRSTPAPNTTARRRAPVRGYDPRASCFSTGLSLKAKRSSRG